MFQLVDEKFKKVCTMEGSFLKKRRSIGGGEAGLMAAGLMLIGLGLLFAIMGIATYSASGDSFIATGGFVALAALAVLGVLLVVPGKVLRGRRINGYMEYYIKDTGYTKEQLELLDQEVLEADSMYHIETRKPQSNSSLFCILITKNWLVLQFMITRIIDVAALFFEKEPFYKGTKRDDSLFILRSNGTLYCMSCKKNNAAAFIQAITSRNPSTISVRKVQVQDQIIDCMKQPEEMASLYRKIVNSKTTNA